jgi:hypothetical protein
MLLISAYLAASAVLWFISHQLASPGYAVTFSRVLIATLFMVLCDSVSSIYLKNIIGGWWFLVSFIAAILIAKGFLRLTLVRSTFAVAIFLSIVLGSILVVGFISELRKIHSY